MAGTPQNYGLLEKKQRQWREDINILLGRRVADTTHHAEFPSAYRSAARRQPAPPSAACLRPRRGYSMAEKTLPCGETELCIQCEQQHRSTDDQPDTMPDCVNAIDGLLAL